MNHDAIIASLESNAQVFSALLTPVADSQARWRPNPDRWSLLDIVCHLGDEEREDFRARCAHLLESKGGNWPGIDPQAWVRDRNYAGRDFGTEVAGFLAKRRESVAWLRGLDGPVWSRALEWQNFGSLSAGNMLACWLAHDYHHIRQINALLYDWHREQVHPLRLEYAGNW